MWLLCRWVFRLGGGEGGCMATQAQQRFRGQRSEAELEATSLDVQTVMYRAPEVLFNEQD